MRLVLESSEGYVLWVSPDRMTLVRVWEDGQAEIATRDHPDATWGPPRRLERER